MQHYKGVHSSCELELVQQTNPNFKMFINSSADGFYLFYLFFLEKVIELLICEIYQK